MARHTGIGSIGHRREGGSQRGLLHSARSMLLLPRWVSRAKLGKRDRFRRFIPDHLHGHVTGHLVRIALDDVREDVGTFLQRHQRHHVGKILPEGRVEGHMVHRERLDGPSAGCRDPAGILRQAIRAEEGRRPPQLSAIAALLDAEDMLPAPVPEGMRVRVDFRQRLCIGHKVYSLLRI